MIINNLNMIINHEKNLTINLKQKNNLPIFIRKSLVNLPTVFSNSIMSK